MRNFYLLFLLLLIPGLVLSEGVKGRSFGGVEYVSYSEPGIMTEKGWLPFVASELEFGLGDSDVSLGLQGSFAFGNLVYEGSTFDGDPITQKTVDRIISWGAFLNYQYEKFDFSLGYSQRRWMNDLVVSYRRFTTYHFLPFRLLLDADFVRMRFQWNLFLAGLNRSTVSEADPARSDVELPQNSGMGFEVGLEFPFGSSYFAGLNYRMWSIDDSESAFDGVDDLYEPANRSNTVQLLLGWQY